MELKITDGGRSETGYKGNTNDCVVRSITIVTGLPYQQVYDDVNALCQVHDRIVGKKSTSRTGIQNMVVRQIMKKYGGEWKATMGIGTGCRVHLRDGEIPMKGKIICNVSKHVVAVIDGVIHDNHDPRRDGTRCVYGYWSFV